MVLISILLNLRHNKSHFLYGFVARTAEGWRVARNNFNHFKASHPQLGVGDLVELE